MNEPGIFEDFLLCGNGPTRRSIKDRVGWLLPVSQMPLYTFHLDNGHRISSDEETLPNRKAAHRAAEEIARDLSRNRTPKGKSRIVATDKTGTTVAEVHILGS